MSESEFKMKFGDNNVEFFTNLYIIVALIAQQS